MSALSTWISRRRKVVASTLVVAVVVGVPLTAAALHPGFPVNDVDLTARDVWVTNGEQLLGGRLNRQIEELNGSVVAASADFDIVQHGDNLFMYDPAAGRVESVSPSTTEITSSIDVPVGSEISYGGDVLAVVSPQGDLWTLSAVGDLVFNYAQTDPLVRLGEGGHAVVTAGGAVIGVSREDGAVHRIEALGADIVESEFPSIGEFELTAVGERAVALDTTTSTVVTEDGTAFELEQDALRLQQVGAESPSVLVATGDALLAVDLGSGEAERHDADVDTPATDPADVAAPVFLDGCAHGAWAGAQRYLFACGDDAPTVVDIEEPTQGGRLEFRVNRSVIALNDLVSGNVWLLGENMRLVDNWEDVTPPEEAEGEEGDEKSATQSLADTLAERTEQNRPPIAVDDVFGVRPGKTTIIPVLDNDTDPDGDVLVITSTDAVAETTGKLDLIDGGRALQFTPARDFVGGVTIAYQVQDGRPNGSASARVTMNVRPTTVNEAPVSQRLSATTTEANQTVSYNVLNDWRDPDGDDLFLVGAAPKSGDLVRFTPDGFVTFSHRTSELGVKEITVQIGDGIGEPVTGTLTVDVKETGSLDPIGTPDFATAFAGEQVVVEPLINDLSPSGAQLALAGAQEPEGGGSIVVDGDRDSVAFAAPDPGVYYVEYTLAAGARSSVGIIRFDVVEPADDAAPVAVKDTAYLRGDEPTTVSVLSNDVSPSGRVLAVQSIDVAPELTARGLVVELLESTLIRVTSPQALTEQVSFSYTVSDGVGSATAGVTVVPVPPLTKHQPPVAVADAVKVRAGDIVTVPVLDNDFHPDDATMRVSEELVSQPTAGIAFVDDDTVRFQAPTDAGEHRVDYEVVDEFGESGAAAITFTVTPLDEDSNQDPVPQPLVARVLSGGAIRVDIPLESVDPDGDSVQLLDFPSNPALGSVTSQGIDHFVYESAPGLAGTDEFDYDVVDAFGAVGTGSIKIAVVPEPAESLPPNAVPDSVAVRPGTTAQVDLTANDSDPQGARIKVEERLIDVPDGIPAEVVDRRFLVIEAPEEEQSFSLRYELTNDLGGSSVSYVQVQVTPDAPLLPPTADDIVIPVEDIAGERSVVVDVYDSVFDPGGRTDDLVVSIEGPNAASAELTDRAGRVEVTPGETRQAIAYRVLNDENELDAMAFILVPAATTDAFDDPPVIDPSLPVQYIAMNETRRWDLSEIVFAPSGRDVIITDQSTVTGIQGNGDSIYVDDDTLEFTPARDYRGPAAINFTVTDGSSPKDPNGIVAALTLNIVVGDPEFRDTPPEFTAPSVDLEAGEQAVVDLRASTSHPNPQILQEISYGDLAGGGSRVDAQLGGSQLTLSAPRNTPKGTTVTLEVTLRWGEFEVPGSVDVTVVSSSRPLAVAVTDTAEARRGAGTTVVPVLANDSNPFQTSGEPLRVLSAEVDNSGRPASVSVSGDSVRITPNPNLKSGEIVVIYRVADATEDPEREVNGTVSLTVSDVPDQVAKPARAPDSAIGGDRTVSFVFQAPATNGKPITGYEVQTQPGTEGVTCTAGAPCTLTGLDNGTAYQLSARAVNQNGAGQFSAFSEPVTPYGTPADVGAPSGTKEGRQWAPVTIRWSWPAVSQTGGGSVSYEWSVNGGAVQTTTATSATTSGAGAGDYTVSVRAVNPGGRKSVNATSSAPVNVQNQPPPAQPGRPSGQLVRGGQEAAIDWSWPAVEDTGGLYYRWGLQKWPNELRGAITGRSQEPRFRMDNLPPGDYVLNVHSVNDAGQSVRSELSAVVTVPPPPPSVSVRLDRGAQRTCTSGNDCYLYEVTLVNFDTTLHDVSLYCNGKFERNVGFSGNRYTSDFYCGFPNTYVVVDGTKSNEVNFNP